MIDPDYLVLLLFILGTIAAFQWRRTGKTPWRYAWLALMWVEVQVRKWRDRKGGKRGV